MEGGSTCRLEHVTQRTLLQQPHQQRLHARHGLRGGTAARRTRRQRRGVSALAEHILAHTHTFLAARHTAQRERSKHKRHSRATTRVA